MEKEKLGVLLAIVTAFFSGIAIPANKIFIVNTDPAVFTAVRSIIIGIVFLVLALSFNKKEKKKSKTKVKFTSSWKYLAGIAVIGGALAFLLYFTGLKLTTAGRAAFLHKTLPLYVAVLAFIFLKEKLTRKYIYAMGIMIVGIIAIYATSINPTELWSNPQLGDLLILSAAFLWAVENVMARKSMTGGDSNFVVSFARMFFGGLILMGVVILTGKIDILLALSQQQMFNIFISTLLLFCYVFFFYWSLKLINASKAASFLLIAPVVSLIIGIIFLGEPAPLLQLVGSALILAGAFFMTKIKSEQRGI